MVKAVEANVTTDQRWIVLYVKRWLAAPLRLPDGTLAERDRGTPQGSAISPVLANLFMHYAFDLWLAREFPAVEFERYADDAVVHCVTERQAREVLAALAERIDSVGLRLHPDKTKIVYCKDDGRHGTYEHTSFTFLGYTFPLTSKGSRRGAKVSRVLGRFKGARACVSAGQPRTIGRFWLMISGFWFDSVRGLEPPLVLESPRAGALDPCRGCRSLAWAG
ncbi:reverse transcriptase domain-containing protein [Saccharopolyspora shandongensis]|uniref:reverse transcriptase domain-containing protein n=1 Tax=Saccharopolyspora shandongensis TaxID=418495 RepID=UPI0033C1A97D